MAGFKFSSRLRPAFAVNLFAVGAMLSFSALPARAAPGETRAGSSPAPASTLLPGMGKQWTRFTMLVWPYKTPPPGPEAARLYESVNLHGVGLNALFPQADLDFAIAHHFSFYLDHTAGKGDLFLYPEVWQKFEDAYRKDRSRPVRPVSLWDPTVLTRVKRNLQTHIRQVPLGDALAYAFDDEISVTSYTTPADVDWSPEGLERFRDWLRTRYGSLANLNAEWHTAFTRWEDVIPQVVDDLAPNYALPLNRWNLAPWADHREFMDITWANLLANLTHVANGIDPRTPAGFEGGQAPAAHGGYDYARLTRSVQWMEAYDIGDTDEILQSFWGSQHPHMQTYFLSDDPHLDRWFLWYYLVHGDRGVICWPESAKGPWFQGSTVSPSVTAVADTFREVQGPLSESFRDAHYDHDGIGIYYSQPSIRVSWFMDIQPHGRTWPYRSSSMNNENATDLLNRLAWTKLLADAGYQYNFVSYLDVQDRGVQALNRYKILILPRTLALSDREAAAIREFVRRGGTVIADYLPGVFDEHDRGRTVGALDDVFGVQRNGAAGVLNNQTVAEVNAEKNGQPLSQRLSYDGALKDPAGFVLYERGLQSQDPAVASVGGSSEGVQARFGRGLAFYNNWTPLPYLSLRSDPAGALYRRRLSAELRVNRGGKRQGMAPRVQVVSGGKEMPMVQRLFWTKNGRHYLCVVLNLVRNASINGMGSAQSAPLGSVLRITLRFAAPVTVLKNERTGKLLGSGRTLKDRWKTDEANIYSW